jgi:hypothetical protein
MAHIVNEHLRCRQPIFTRGGLPCGMAGKRVPPGSKKGQPKPQKRRLDPNFHIRLKQAMGLTGDEEHDKGVVPKIARKVACERATLHNYIAGGKIHIEALLLFKLADTLEVSPRWLLTGEGGRGGLTKNEIVLLQRYRAMKPDERDLIDNMADKMGGEQQG